jgi:hypothetical protein
MFSYISIAPFHELTEMFVVDENDLNDAQIKPTSNLHLLREDYFNTTHLSCRYPTLTIDNPEIWKYLSPVRKLQPDCGKTTNWVYVENG